MNHKQMSQKGGNATKAKYGKNYYRDIGKMAAKTNLDKYGPEYFRILSKAGVEARRKKKELALKKLADNDVTI